MVASVEVPGGVLAVNRYEVKYTPRDGACPDWSLPIGRARRVFGELARAVDEAHTLSAGDALDDVRRRYGICCGDCDRCPGCVS